MPEAGLELPLVADDAQSLALPRRQAKVNLHADGVHEEREPTGHAEVETESGGDACFAAEAGLDRDPIVRGAVDGGTLREFGFELLPTVLKESDFRARHGAVVATIGTDDKGADDHDDAQRDDRTGVKPRPKHPGAVLLDLEPLDIVVCHGST